jgi:hypothetical protein
MGDEKSAQEEIARYRSKLAGEEAEKREQRGVKEPKPPVCN